MVKIDFEVKKWFKVYNNIYIIIYFAEFGESDFDFDHFDLDHFDHASLSTKPGKMV